MRIKLPSVTGNLGVKWEQGLAEDKKIKGVGFFLAIYVKNSGEKKVTKQWQSQFLWKLNKLSFSQFSLMTVVQNAKWEVEWLIGVQEQKGIRAFF